MEAGGGFHNVTFAMLGRRVGFPAKSLLKISVVKGFFHGKNKCCCGHTGPLYGEECIWVYSCAVLVITETIFQFSIVQFSVSGKSAFTTVADDAESNWFWRWLPVGLSKRQSMWSTTVLFKTTLNRTITPEKLTFILPHFSLFFESLEPWCWPKWTRSCAYSSKWPLVLRQKGRLLGYLIRETIVQQNPRANF